MRIIIGISGASGVVMGYEILKALRAADVETHLVVTEAAARTLACETSLCLEDLTALASVSTTAGIWRLLLPAGPSARMV